MNKIFKFNKRLDLNSFSGANFPIILKVADTEKICSTQPDALITRNGKDFVFLIKDDRVVQTPVTTGIQIGDTIEVLDGIKQDDKVAVKPKNKLKDGSRIKVIEK